MFIVMPLSDVDHVVSCDVVVEVVACDVVAACPTLASSCREASLVRIAPPTTLRVGIGLEISDFARDADARAKHRDIRLCSHLYHPCFAHELAGKAQAWFLDRAGRFPRNMPRAGNANGAYQGEWPEGDWNGAGLQIDFPISENTNFGAGPSPLKFVGKNCRFFCSSMAFRTGRYRFIFVPLFCHRRLLDHKLSPLSPLLRPTSCVLSHGVQMRVTAVCDGDFMIGLRGVPRLLAATSVSIAVRARCTWHFALREH